MDVCCSFKSLVGGQCLAFDHRDRKQSMDIVPLLSCTKNTTRHKSLDLVKSHCVTLCLPQGRSTCNFLALGKIYCMLILQIRARFFRLPSTTETVSPLFSSLARFFRSPPITETVFPSSFLARPRFSLAPNYRDSLPPFFPRSPAFFARPQLPRQSSPLFSSLARFFRSPPTTKRVPPFFFPCSPPTTESLD